jgi:hypothetical protein
MPAPVLQFKRGNAGVAGTVPALRPGEPAISLNNFDFFIGIDTSVANNKFFGSHRYWKREDATNAAQLRLVDKDGSNYIAIAASDTLSGVATYRLPNTNNGSTGDFLKLKSASGGFYDLEWAAVPSGSFTIAGDSGSDTFTTGETLTFTGGEGIDSVVTNNTVTISAEAASSTNAGIASYRDEFYFTDTYKVGIVTATDTVKGIASFDSNDFVVTSGNVAINDEHVQDIVGAMVTGNTETLITVTYQDGDGTLDFVVDNDLANYSNTNSAFITASSTNTLTNKTFDANGTGNSLSNVEVADFAASAIVTEAEGLNSSDNDTSIPTTAAVKNYVDTNGNVSISGDTGTATVSTGATFSFTGTDPVVIAASGAGVTFSISDAAADGSTKGIATFDTDDFDSSSGLITLGNSANGAVLVINGTTNEVEVSRSNGTVTIGLPNDVQITTSLDVPTVEATNLKAKDGTTAITITDSTGAVTTNSDLTVGGNLYVNGSTTQVNTSSLTVEDRTIELGIVNGSAPSATTTWDLGVLFNYYQSSAKKSAVVWEQGDARFKFASEISDGGGTDNDSPQITFTSYAPIEIGSLWVNDCAGQSQVISCTGTTRYLENITIDAGVF